MIQYILLPVSEWNEIKTFLHFAKIKMRLKCLEIVSRNHLKTQMATSRPQYW